MLDKEFQFYLDNKADLVGKYVGKFIVIIGTEVVGSYEDEFQAYLDASEKFELGTFLIQEVASDDSAHTQIFHSRVTL